MALSIKVVSYKTLRFAPCLLLGRSKNILNFENALKHVTGNIIVITDQDDVWLDGKIDKMNRVLRNFDLI
jgi:hypothetical protein